MPITVLGVVGARLLAFYVFKTYSGIIRYAGLYDVSRIFAAVSISHCLLLAIHWSGWWPGFYYAYSIAVIDVALAILLLLAYRFCLVFFFRYVKRSLQSSQPVQNVIVYGADDLGLSTKRALENDQMASYRVVGFYDQAKNLAEKILDGAWVIGKPSQLSQAIKRLGVQKIIFTSPNFNTEQSQALVDLCLGLGVGVLKVPPVNQWVNGQFRARQLQQINIEELLERDPIVLDPQHIVANVANKVVLVTGAAGSIGRELARQLALLKPSQLILLDKAESPLHELQLLMHEELHQPQVITVLANITQPASLEAVFTTFRPQLVYHAAAYKHVPMLEDYPAEAVSNNVLGTKVVADLAVKYGTDCFVLVSTDKAVNPTNVMGASKRIAEIYVQALNRQVPNQRTRFIVTRFGNVLGSDGSVIPRFKKQIEAGGPITVTSPQVTRYFMTIPEACQLILEASTMGKSGEIFIFDMGKSVKIVDLAHKMIRLAGFEPDKDIALIFTGLRPGEKIEEELLAKSENMIPTHNKKIMIGKDAHSYTLAQITAHIQELSSCLPQHDDLALVRLMKHIVPEFVSNNSRFQVLDSQSLAV
ncbi:MAG: polysaccharide biosynthesis protein [Bernardetiaceae bacterium]|nr:polysaccharide biosynthesis protein [Bernardetiaceae bacterium]